MLILPVMAFLWPPLNSFELWEIKIENFQMRRPAAAGKNFNFRSAIQLDHPVCQNNLFPARSVCKLWFLSTGRRRARRGHKQGRPTVKGGVCVVYSESHRGRTEEREREDVIWTVWGQTWIVSFRATVTLKWQNRNCACASTIDELTVH